MLGTLLCFWGRTSPPRFARMWSCRGLSACSVVFQAVPSRGPGCLHPCSGSQRLFFPGGLQLMMRPGWRLSVMKNVRAGPLSVLGVCPALVSKEAPQMGFCPPSWTPSPCFPVLLAPPPCSQPELPQFRCFISRSRSGWEKQSQSALPSGPWALRLAEVIGNPPPSLSILGTTRTACGPLDGEG